MLKQETRERLQALVHNPKFVGSVHISDNKYEHDLETIQTVVDIHSRGFNVFTLLTELFPDMALTNVKPYETDQGDYFTFGNTADGSIEDANVNIWARYGERKDPALTESHKEITYLDSITDMSCEEIARREA